MSHIIPPSLKLFKISAICFVKDAKKLTNAFMTLHIDYCNSFLGGFPTGLSNKLQLVSNATARVLTGSKTNYHSNLILQALH